MILQLIILIFLRNVGLKMEEYRIWDPHLYQYHKEDGQ